MSRRENVKKTRKSIFSRYVKDYVISFGKRSYSKSKEKLIEPVTIHEIDCKLVDSDGIKEENDREKPNIDDYVVKEPYFKNDTATVPPPCRRRPPCSATDVPSRTITELYSGLKEFKLTTAASRESLRTCQHDHCQIEKTVKIMIRSRPSTPVIERWRSRITL